MAGQRYRFDLPRGEGGAFAKFGPEAGPLGRGEDREKSKQYQRSEQVQDDAWHHHALKCRSKGMHEKRKSICAVQSVEEL